MTGCGKIKELKEDVRVAGGMSPKRKDSFISVTLYAACPELSSPPKQVSRVLPTPEPKEDSIGSRGLGW